MGVFIFLPITFVNVILFIFFVRRSHSIAHVSSVWSWCVTTCWWLLYITKILLHLDYIWRTYCIRGTAPKRLVDHFHDSTFLFCWKLSYIYWFFIFYYVREIRHNIGSNRSSIGFSIRCRWHFRHEQFSKKKWSKVFLSAIGRFSSIVSIHVYSI